MEISSHYNLNEKGEVVNKKISDENKRNHDGLISSHNIVPNNKEFTKKDFDKWIDENIEVKK